MEWLSAFLDIMFDTLNSVIQNMVGLLSQSPEAFNGTLYAFAKGLNSVFQATGLALVVLFFFIGLSDPSHNLAEIKRPEAIIAEFARFLLCQLVVANSYLILQQISAIGTSLISTAWSAVTSGGGMPTISADGTVKEALNEVKFNILSISTDMIMLILLNFIMIVTLGIIIIYISVIAYVRFFKIYMYIAIAPLALSTFAARNTSEVGKQFLKSFCGVLLQGLVLVLSLLMFAMFFSNTTIDGGDGAITVVWEYFISMFGQLFVLVTVVKGSDQIIQKMLGI